MYTWKDLTAEKIDYLIASLADQAVTIPITWGLPPMRLLFLRHFVPPMPAEEAFFLLNRDAPHLFHVLVTPTDAIRCGERQ